MVEKIQEVESFPGWQMVAATSAVVWSLLLGAPLWWMTALLVWAGESNGVIPGAVLTYLFLFGFWVFPTWGLAACTSYPGLVWLLCALGTPGSAIVIGIVITNG